MEREQSLEWQLKDKEREMIVQQAKIVNLKGPTGGEEVLLDKIKLLQESRGNL